MKKMIMVAVCLMAAFTFAAHCAATTKRGTQCKRNASPDSQYCWQHGGTTKAERMASGESTMTHVSQCAATTKRGTRCKRRARSGGKYCAQHALILGDIETDTPVTKPVKKTTEADVAGPVVDGFCQGKTKKGTQCKRKAKAGSKFCWQHNK